ncbi:GNAT family N-acetyltransferase [Ideonella sp. B508-1]|uniref:GNAT family N-acetyltransferase n=1 Tax=Ideonella sp. B508-1 TaxID=137716 RepID=UPI0035B539FE
MQHTLRVVDPQGEDALSLLREAAIEARALYPELHADGAPWPGNSPTPPGGTYVIAYDAEVPIGCGALRPIDSAVVEVRRMYVRKSARCAGVARKILEVLEASATRMGYKVMRLETGNRQQPAMALYESFGFERIVPFGEYANDPTSVCYEKHLPNRADA